METKQWTAFVDNFISSVNKVVPFYSFFSYEVHTDNSNNVQSYHCKNLTQESIYNYLSSMCHYDPVFPKNNIQDSTEIMMLHEQSIPYEYHFFLKENKVIDNIELFFKDMDTSLRGISLIRNSNENFFSDQEIRIIESCYSLAKFNASQLIIHEPDLKLPKSILQDLTNKEKQVLTLVLKGKKNQVIADELFVSVTTIKTHIQHILRKTMVSSKQELIFKLLS